MERDCCKFICGAPTTFQGYGIESNRRSVIKPGVHRERPIYIYIYREREREREREKINIKKSDPLDLFYYRLTRFM